MTAAGGTEEDIPYQDLAEPIMALSNLGRTVDGSGFAYRTLDCIGKRISGIKAIEAYAHLQHVDLSQNGIKDIAPVKGLPHLLRLNLSSNEIPDVKSWDEGCLLYLAHLDLSSNALTALPALTLPQLRKATFARNEIVGCQDFTGHEKLVELDLSENHITSLEGVGKMPLLKKLDVSFNELSTLAGLTDLPILQDLSLRKNLFESLEAPWQEFEGLTSLVVSENKLEAAKPLESLRRLLKLKSLDVAGNPFCDDAALNTRIETLICHWRLETIDGATVTDQEREDARQLNVQRLLEERERKKAEAEVAAAAEGGDD